MIRQVVIRHFKRFREETFDIPDQLVLAGPNNTGKTTLLQAIAAWNLAFDRWKQLNDFHKHNKAYTRAPIARHDFSAVPLRAFDLLWTERQYQRRDTIEIEVDSVKGWRIIMELIPNTTEQIYVRPKPDSNPEALRSAELKTVHVPSMTGLGTNEPVYERPMIDLLLGQGKPGDIIRNLLAQTHRMQSENAWPALQRSIRQLFGYEIFPPNTSAAHIIAEYAEHQGGPRLDIASAGSGFQQVLMLLTFLYARPASVLLIDEPDAHLHVILQDAIYGELRSVAAKQNSQLIIATHSEVIINSVELRELRVLFDRPRPLADAEEKRRLSESLGTLMNTDIMLAGIADGILYVEGHTDIDILREWAKILGHPAYETLTTKLFWKPVVWEPRVGGSGIKAEDHYEALRLVRSDLPGLIIRDGDNDPRMRDTDITGRGLQRIRWRRYEIESYLIHPDALARYVVQSVGDERSAQINIEDLQQYFEDNYPPAVIRDPLGDHAFLNSTKARTELIPPALSAAGLHGVPYTSYHEIAAVMRREEIHPEVIEKLNAIQRAFRL